MPRFASGRAAAALTQWRRVHQTMRRRLRESDTPPAGAGGLLLQTETSGSILWGESGHDGCICLTVGSGYDMLHDLYVAIFAATAGFTASGILANLYRMAVKKRAETTVSRIAYLVVMVVAGPTVLFNNAAKSWREKSCSGVAFGLAAALAGYWSFAIGLLVLQVALAL